MRKGVIVKKMWKVMVSLDEFLLKIKGFDSFDVFVIERDIILMGNFLSYFDRLEGKKFFYSCKLERDYDKEFG